jgi:UDP-2,3-diacylglucosamine pyrophosphatase LpxH
MSATLTAAMPDFLLASIPGVDGELRIAEDASGVPLQVGLKDAVLFLPGQQKLPLTASHQRGAGNTHLITLTGTFTPPILLLADQLALESISLVARFRQTASGMVLDTASSGAVVANGLVKWIGAVALGLPAGVDLVLSYRFSGTGGGFALALANLPLTVPPGLAEIRSAEITAERPANRPVLVVGLRGQAGVTSAGQSNINQLLRQVFPSAPSLQPLGFVVKQEFALTSAGGAAPQPVGEPFFRIDFDWATGTPSLANVPPALRIDLGTPTFSFPMGTGTTPTGWTFRLPDTGIRFPDIPSLAPFQLLGTLHLEAGSTNQLSFEPSADAGFDLPDPLQFLVSRLGWGGTRTPLDAVADEAQMTSADFDWQELFEGLIPDPIPASGLDLAALGQQIDQALAAVISSGIPVDRAFFTAMQGLAGGGKDAYRVVWQKWFDVGGPVLNPFGQLPALMLSMQGMPAASFDAAVAALFDIIPDFAAYAANLLTAWQAGGDLQFQDFLRLTTRSLTVALLTLPQARLDLLGAGLIDSLVGVAELQPLRTLPGLPRMPTGDALLASAFADLDRLGGSGVHASSLFSAMTLASKRGTPAEQRRAKDALLNTGALAHSSFLLGVIWDAAVRHLMPWWDLIARPVNRQTRGDEVLTLSRQSNRRFLILSDIHRDRLSDIQPPFDFNSISHFQANKPLFLKILAWLKKSENDDYVLIEGGDCEELWFLRDPDDDDRAQILRDIIADNPDVYDRLRELHAANRYYRIYGNHDSQLRHPDIHAILKTEMERGGAPTFRIYDFIIIDDVKQMVEHAWLDKARQAIAGVGGGQTPQQIARELARGTLGMDAKDYTARCRMVVTHGHQWDFYNCDSNNELGMFIAQQVGVRVDKAMDPILLSRGIAIGGNPWIDFGDVLSRAPVANCWPSETDAVRLAHQVQHLDNDQRKLIDTVMYKESLTALTGTFGIAINAPGSPERTPEQGRQQIDITRPQTILDYLDRHHNHHICIGHTHNPHSQPFFTLRNAATGIPFLGNLLQFFAGALPDLNLLKSKYFNSGTGGWWEGVIWGIQIDGDGQARLVFWTNRTTEEPEVMDWELTTWDPSVRSRFPRTEADFTQLLRDFLENVVGVRPEEVEALLQQLVAVPMEVLHGVMARGEKLFNAVDTAVGEVASGVADSLADFEEEVGKLQQQLFNILLVVRERASGFRRTAEDVFTITISVDVYVMDALAELFNRAPEGSGPDSAAQRLHAAVVAWPLLDRFPHNLVLGGLAGPRFRPERQVVDFATPVLSIFSSIVAFFPPAGRPVAIGDQILKARLEAIESETKLRLTITIKTDEAGATAAGAAFPNS